MINYKINTVTMIGAFAMIFSNCSSPKTDKTKDAALALLATSENKVSCKAYNPTDQEKQYTYVDSKDGKVQIPYKKVGNTKGKKIIVVHGGPGLSSKYNEKSITDCLAHDYQLVFYDQRFTGNSTASVNALGRPLPPYTGMAKIPMSSFVDDLESVRVAALNGETDQTVTLLGHSWGGRLVTEYNTHNTYRNNVKATVLVSSQPIHWSAGNVKTANIVKKMNDYNITDTAKGVKSGAYNLMYIKLTVAAGLVPPSYTDTTLEQKKAGYEAYSKEYFGNFLHNKANLSKLDFSFNDVTAGNFATIFLAPLPVQGTPYQYNKYDALPNGITGLSAGGDDKSLTGFPDKPILLMHGKSDPIPYQYVTGGENDTKDVLNIATFGAGKTGIQNTIKQVYEGRKSGSFPSIDGDKMFGATGVSIYHRLKTQASVSEANITKVLMDKTGHFPSVENPTKFAESIKAFMSKVQ